MRPLPPMLLPLLASAAMAGPTTRPAAPTPPIPPAALVGQAIDPARPAFVPKFAKVDNPPAGQFEERRYAYVYTYPTPFFYGSGGYGGYSYGYCGFGAFGYGFGGRGSWGSTQVPFR